MQRPEPARTKAENLSSSSAPDLEMAQGSSSSSSNNNNQQRPGRPTDTEYEFVPFNWKNFFFKPKYIPLHIIAIIAGVATALLTIYHDQVVEYLTPFSQKVRDLPAGWIIPIVILILISFPPLFGHELVALLCGVIYGLWEGFLVVAAGTFLGEVGTWFAFKSLLRKKAVKLERTNLNYASLARLTRDGGFWIVFWIRFSVIPSHFSTAVFATCDVKFWHFALATFLTLPKQIVLVYLGVLLVSKGGESTVKNVVLAITFVVTIVVGWIIYSRMRKVKKALIQEQNEKKASQAEEVKHQAGQNPHAESTVSIPMVYQNPKPEYASSGPTESTEQLVTPEARYWARQGSSSPLPRKQSGWV